MSGENPLFPNRVTRLDSRFDYILKVCKNKIVLHVGCADVGFELVHKNAGILLHPQIESVARVLFGIDIDDAGIEKMRSEGHKNIHQIDITNPRDQRKLISKLRDAGGLDIIIAGEVIEHVPDPINFTKSLAVLTKEFNARCIITTPNAYYFGNFFQAMKRNECVHPDHNFYFTLTTLSTVLRKSGVIKPEFKMYLNLPNSGIRRLFKKLVTRMSPMLADGIIADFNSHNIE